MSRFAGVTAAIVFALAATAGATSASAATACGSTGVFSTSNGDGICTYTSAGSSDVFTVPSYVSQVSITAVGGRGGAGGTYNNVQDGAGGGYGARLVDGGVPVSSSSQLTVYVAGNGGAGGVGTSGGAGGGGYGQGGPGGDDEFEGGGGGGASAVLNGNTLLEVAGGGGGGTGFLLYTGGGPIPAGTGVGGAAGIAGGNGTCAVGGGAGTSSGPGAGGGTLSCYNDSGAFGSPGVGHNGGAGGSSYASAGGGGGGYYGGGGGQGVGSANGAGGGGGSSYSIDQSASITTDSTGTPKVAISWALATPTIIPSGSAVAALGATLSASATVSGGDAPGGTVTFAVYANAAGTGSPVYTETDAVNAGSATAGTSGSSYTFTAPGQYSWVATYNGDGYNKSVSTAPSVVMVAHDQPALTLTPTLTPVSVGSTVSASATVVGGYSPTGTVDFALYNNIAGTGTPVCSFSGVALSGSEATSPTTCVITAAGNYYWAANYHGDANNLGATTGTSAATLVVVQPVTPAIAFNPAPSGAMVGSAISATATVSGGYSPTGTVTFKLYDNSAGNGTAVCQSTIGLVGGSATSTGCTVTQTGTFYWVASYNGDTNNSSVGTIDAGAPVLITRALPTINSSGSAGAALGATLNASATVSGGYAPGGTVTFAVYGNATGTGTPIYTETEPLSGGAATAGTSGSRYTFTAAGTYSWVATYNGDGDNTSVSTAPTVVTVAEDAPTLKLTPTQTSASSGAAVSASAALSGGYSPGGTVTFKLYSDPDASGTPVCQSTIALAGGSATSAGCTVMQTGTYYWVASYSGDANNVAVSTPVAAAPVTITAVSAAGGGASGGGSTSGSGGSGSTTVSPTGSVSGAVLVGGSSTKGEGARFKVRCRLSTGACRIRARLTYQSGRRTTVVASVSVSVAAGRTKLVSVMLDRAGRTLLAKHKVLRVKLTGAYVVGSDTHVLITREFELRLARA